MIDLINECPNCHSKDLHQEIQGDNAILEFNDDKISAMKFDTNSSPIAMIGCNNCGAALKPTIDGYREV